MSEKRMTIQATTQITPNYSAYASRWAQREPGLNSVVPYQKPGNAKQPSFSSSSMLLQGIRGLMDPINNSRLLELFISDFLGMTLPRTTIETKIRGPESGRETLFRELVGGLTPVYVCGWAGALVILGLEKMPFNPKKMSFRAWIDSSMLNHFAETTVKILPTAKNAQDLKEKFTRAILSKLQSTDQIYNIADYKRFLPEGGKLSGKALDRLISRLTSFTVLDYTPGGFLDAEQKSLHKKFIAKLTDYAIEEGGLSSRVVLVKANKQANTSVGARSVNDVLSKVSYFLDEYLGRVIQDSRCGSKKH